MEPNQIQYQIQVIEMQRQQIMAQIEELKETIAEVDKATGRIFQFHGMLLIESNKEEARAKLNEMLELLNNRVKAMDMQMERIKKLLEKETKENQ